MGAHDLIINTVRRLENLFPNYFQTTSKRNHYIDFGYPESITFEQFHSLYARNGIARAAVEKTILKTWQDNPVLQEDEDFKNVTDTEKLVDSRFSELRFWQKIAEADRRSIVGGFAGVIFRFADNKKMGEPVDSVPGGLEGLVEIIPAWSGQLEVSEWDQDEQSESYGQPKMFSFKEASVGGSVNTTRSFELHPDRVAIWSVDSTVHAQSMLSPGYNDLITLEKIIGAGGEGFWKNAKSAPILQVDKDAKISEMAKAMGVDSDELADKMDEQVEEWQKGFDSLLMLQGMEAKTLGVTLPKPAEFVNVALQSFAASIGMPLKILVGSQTGERASTEDAKEWSQTIMARRNNTAVPNILSITDRLKRVGVLPDKDWSLHWPDLTESSMAEKIERADKMAGVNLKQSQAGGFEVIFSDDEIREAVGMDPLSDAEARRTPENSGEKNA